MRFKTFLKEERIVKIDDVLKRISDECQQFLKESKALPLYRGFGNKRNPSPDIGGTFLPHPEDRPALDSSPDFNFMFNAAVDAAFGIRDIRKKSLFCTGDYQTAQQFGTINFIFPAGDIDYIWSPRINDSYDDSTKIKRDIISNLSKAINDTELNDMMEYFSKRVSPNDFADIAEEDTIAMGIKDAMEGDRVPPTQAKMANAFGNAINDLYENNNGLDKAIKSKNEILIYKSDGYYLLPIVAVRQMLINDKTMTQLGAEALPLTDLYQKLIDKIRSI
jgi:hypothetical protein